MTLGVSAIASMTSSVNAAGCGLVNRTRSRPVDLAAGAQQLAEGQPVAELDAVGVDVLAEQGHLDDALGDERLDLGEDVAGAAVLLLAAQRGHDAERAGVVAADRDRHPAAVGGLAAGRQGRREDLERLEDLDLGLAVVRGPGRAAPAASRCCGCRRRRRPTAPCSTMVARSFCARQPPTAICMPGFAALTGAQVAEVAVELVVGVLADRAGVEDDDVGARRRRRRPRRRSRRPRAGRRAARSRARSSGTRRCAPRRSSSHRKGTRWSTAAP